MSAYSTLSKPDDRLILIYFVTRANKPAAEPTLELRLSELSLKSKSERIAYRHDNFVDIIPMLYIKAPAFLQQCRERYDYWAWGLKG